MNVVYGEAVNVQAREDGRPTRFVWRSRLYTVRAILEHWVINRERAQDPRSEQVFIRLHSIVTRSSRTVTRA